MRNNTATTSISRMAVAAVALLIAGGAVHGAEEAIGGVEAIAQQERSRIGNESTTTPAYFVVTHRLNLLLEILPQLEAQHRSIDVFGLPNNGDMADRLVEESTQQKADAAAMVEEDEGPTLAMALQRLQISGIDPDNREFFIGARSVFEGDRITLNFAGRQFVARIKTILPRSIVMEEEGTGTLATIRINVIPRGEGLPEISE